MLGYTIRRMLYIIPIMIGVSLIVFSIMHMMPGDPAYLILGEGVPFSPEAVEDFRRELGLHLPLHTQYLNFLKGALVGDLGNSVHLRAPVASILRNVIPMTLQLTLAGLSVAILLGVLLGVLAAVFHNTFIDFACMFFAIFGISMPIFWLGLLLMYVFAINLQWFPVSGMNAPYSLVLPAVTLGVRAAAVVARLTRSSMLDVLRQDYIRTARAKGLNERVVILRHGFRNALIPVVTMVGLQFGRLLSGAVVVETVFARRGLGLVAINAILGRDIPLVQGVVLFAALIFVLVNLAIDLSYSFIDPRIRYS